MNGMAFLNELAQSMQFHLEVRETVTPGKTPQYFSITLTQTIILPLSRQLVSSLILFVFIVLSCRTVGIEIC